MTRRLARAAVAALALSACDPMTPAERKRLAEPRPEPPPVPIGVVPDPAPLASADHAACLRGIAAMEAAFRERIATLRRVESHLARVNRHAASCENARHEGTREVDAIRPAIFAEPSDAAAARLIVGAWGHMRSCSLACGAQADALWSGKRCRRANDLGLTMAEDFMRSAWHSGSPPCE